MEQTTQYLYEYKQGKRIRNLGFMKMEKQMDKCMIQIYAKNMDDIQGILFRKENDEKYIGGWETEMLPVEADPYIPPRNVTFEKIQRQDLSRLPRREWRLANNSFLLHGFYNYHHLLYIEEDGNIWIGVPGIYHEKEKMAANSFGFSHFRRVVDVDVQLEESETNTYEDFGYWCRQIQSAEETETR